MSIDLMRVSNPTITKGMYIIYIYRKGNIMDMIWTCKRAMETDVHSYAAIDGHQGVAKFGMIWHCLFLVVVVLNIRTSYVCFLIELFMVPRIFGDLNYVSPKITGRPTNMFTLYTRKTNKIHQRSSKFINKCQNPSNII